MPAPHGEESVRLVQIERWLVHSSANNLYLGVHGIGFDKFVVECDQECSPLLTKGLVSWPGSMNTTLGSQVGEELIQNITLDTFLSVAVTWPPEEKLSRFPSNPKLFPPGIKHVTFHKKEPSTRRCARKVDKNE
ncbi:jg15572 [Pararge aegeria aegeria]|uniref:Jg15572 protein n=1 Tax=Pararge aegeria aegeria TaxID=348720 RepID=A0A8S4RSS7_9NEOP|nr:jg15572 [Pararge aegeria aegeria]